eukprot:TRINITY_DN16828_c0_g1_i1.p1 TRINITY_DN16828_c0_g1~~TRINITY_DN16828_c0_g1_i1.p1  ORF type:complete len:417 (-),score=63.12 TRINITY_DN16828_c0_g1_i1:267-1517(-)
MRTAHPGLNEVRTPRPARLTGMRRPVGKAAVTALLPALLVLLPRRASAALTLARGKSRAPLALDADSGVSSTFLGVARTRAINGEGLDDIAASCDVSSLGGPVCFAERRAELVIPAAPEGLVGRWSFDEDVALDSSGFGLHGTTRLTHGPSPTSQGNSALFSRSFVAIPGAAQLRLVDFSVALWAFLLEDDEGAAALAPSWCPLLRKGVHAPSAREFQSAPALLYSAATGGLRVSVTTTADKGPYGEFVDSNARLLPNRWVHLAIAHHGKKLLLYVNGILDAVKTLSGKVTPNSHPLYIGGDPFTVKQCAQALYIDNVRMYSRALTPHELQAEAAPALGGVDPSFVHLGCPLCTLSEAARSCPGSRHVCTALDLHTGAYQVARALGWVRGGTHIWTLGDLERGTKAPEKGLGLCCA